MADKGVGAGRGETEMNRWGVTETKERRTASERHRNQNQSHIRESRPCTPFVNKYSPRTYCVLSPGTSKHRAQPAIRGGEPRGWRSPDPAWVQGDADGVKGSPSSQEVWDPECEARLGAGQPLSWDSRLEKGILWPSLSPGGAGLSLLYKPQGCFSSVRKALS